MFMFVSLFIGILVILLSGICSKCKHKLVDISYAVISVLEFFNRFVLIGNLWVSSKVFMLTLCVVNTTTTCALGIFFTAMYMNPIYAYSPHFRTLYKQSRITY